MARQHMITTAVALDYCRRCAAFVLCAVAEGEPARVDPIPVTELGALVAILSGRRTYWLRPRWADTPADSRGAALVYRDAGRIRAGLITGPILITHRCNQAPADEHRAITPTPETPIDPEGIPF